MNKDLLKLIAVNREAVAVNRGFYYQYLLTLVKWLEHYIRKSDDLIFVEVGDDIREQGDRLVFTQVKCYSSSFSFRSPEIIKALFNFFVLYLSESESNPELRFTFETNTTIPNKETLLKNWAKAEKGLTTPLLDDCVRKVSEILLAELKKIRDRHLASGNLTESRKTEIRTLFAALNHELSTAVFEDFTQRITWKFVEEPPETAVELLYHTAHTLLKDPVFEGQPTELLIEVLLSEIYRRSQLSDAATRSLSRGQLDELLSRRTEELRTLTERKLLDLLDQRFSAINQTLGEIQQELAGLKKQTVFVPENVPQLITALPFIRSSAVLQRETETEALHQQLRSCQHIAIPGAGGKGKSTLAKLYTQLYKDEYAHVIWLNTDPGLLKSIIFQEDLQHHLAIDLEKGEFEEKIFREVLRKIDCLPGPNVLVLDNYSDDSFLPDLLSLNNWRVLFTTRKRLPDLDEYQLNDLTYENALSLYRKHEPAKPAGEELIREFFSLVEYNPLVIEISAKTIHNSVDLDLGRFMELLKTQSLDNGELDISISAPGNVKSSLLAILTRTFDVSGLESNEAHFLKFLALLPSYIKISDLVVWYGAPWAAGNKVAMANLVNNLHEKGWLEREGDDVFLHTMLQESVVYRMRAGKEFITVFQQIAWLTHRLSEGIAGDYAQALLFLRYGESLLRKIREADRENIYQPMLLLENEVLNVYHWIIDEEDKIKRIEDLLQRSIAYLGDEDPFVGIVWNNLGMANAERGNYQSAETQLLTGSEILMRKPESYETQLLYALGNLAMLYIHTGNFEAFGVKFDEAMAFRKKRKLYHDISFPVQSNMLGFAQQCAGKYDAAIRLYKIAIVTHRELPAGKKNDLNLILYLNNLACSNFASGQHDQALKAFGEAVIHLERLAVGNNNKIFAVLLDTLIKIAEQSDDAEMRELLAKLEHMKNMNSI